MRRTIQRWTTNGPLKVATAAAAFLILVVGALTVALISLSTSHTAVTCINDVLAQRQTVNDAPALIEEADASAAWAESLVTVVTEPKPTTAAGQVAQLRQFVAAVHDYAVHLAHAEMVLHEHQAYREAHPLGHC